MNPFGGELPANLTAGRGRNGAGIGDDSSRLGAFDDAVRAGQHLLRHLRVADAGENIIGLLGHLLGSCLLYTSS